MRGKRDRGGGVVRQERVEYVRNEVRRCIKMVYYSVRYPTDHMVVLRSPPNGRQGNSIG